MRLPGGPLLNPTRFPTMLQFPPCTIRARHLVSISCVFHPLTLWNVPQGASLTLQAQEHSRRVCVPSRSMVPAAPVGRAGCGDVCHRDESPLAGEAASQATLFSCPREVCRQPRRRKRSLCMRVSGLSLRPTGPRGQTGRPQGLLPHKAKVTV